MAISYSEHIKKVVSYAKDKFKDFVPQYQSFGIVEYLNWQNKNGRREYQVVFLYDKEYGILTVHGDLGNAIYDFGRDRTFEQICDISVFEYFESKLSCGTEKYEYDEEYATYQLKEHLEYDTLSEWARRKVDHIIVNLLFESCGDINYVKTWDPEVVEELELFDADYEEWVRSIGLLPHIRHILYWQALRQARETLTQTK